jgi:hypothetical protein
VEIWGSIDFEIGLLIIFIYTLFLMVLLERRLKDLKLNYAKVVMVKNFEAQRLCGSLDSDDEDIKVTSK